MMLSIATAQTKDPGAAPGTTGQVSFTYLGKNVTLTSVRTNDGNIWLQQDLGSSRVATSWTDKAGYGDLFQWGRWDDGHQVRQPLNSSRKQAQPNNPTGLNPIKNPFLYDGIYEWWILGTPNDQWSAATASAVTANNGCDPCKALGTGWHLPSLGEWQDILKKEGITDASSGFNSNLKIPMSGVRDAMDLMIKGEKLTGFYWTSSPVPGSTGKAMIAAIAVDGTRMGTYDRGNGLTLRCLKSK